MLCFTPYNPDLNQKIKSYFALIPTYCYEYNLSYVLLWKESEGMEFAFTDNAMFIHQRLTDTFLLPATTEEHMAESLKELDEYCQKSGTHFAFKSIPADFLPYFAEYRTTLDRNLADYLYIPETMAGLHGKHLQAKRNHVAQFEKMYEYTLSPLTPEDKDACLLMDEGWEEGHAQYEEGVKEEEKAIRNAFDSFSSLHIVGLVIRDKGKVIAFTLGEIIDERKMAITHFEKGNILYQGIYEAINNFFTKEYLMDMAYINRQEDVGIEGLRKSKLSYHPVMLAEKVRVCR